MSISNVECWKLIVQSGLLSRQQCQQLSAQYGRSQPTGTSEDGIALLAWLTSQGAISPYQCTTLEAGRPGPFQFGDYKIHDQIEEGRFTGTYRARHVGTNHAVMLLNLDSSQRSRWTRTVPALLRLEHPHIVRMYDLVKLENEGFLVCEDLHGISLQAWQDSKGPVGPSAAFRLAKAIAEALAQLHSEGLVHGSVGPENVWLEPGGNIKLIVDPSSTILEGSTTARASELPPNRTPIQTSRSRDIYGIGRILYGLVTGVVPLVLTHQAAAGLNADGVRRRLPAQVRDIIGRITAETDRLQTAEDLIHALAPMADAAEETIQRPPPLPTQASYELWLREKKSSDVSSGARATLPNARREGGPGPASRQSRATAAKQRVVEARARRRRNSILLGAGVVGAIVLLALGALVLDSWNVAAPPEPNGPHQPASDKPEPDEHFPPTENLLVNDDGQTLWASPTQGQPLSLAFLPSGPQLVMVARLADLASVAEGRRFLKALGPQFGTAYANWLVAAGFQAEQIHQATFGFYGNNGQFPRVSIVIHLKRPHSAEEMRANWDVDSPRPGTPRRGADVYVNTEWTYFIPSKGSDQVFVMGHSTEIQSLAESEQIQPLLRRELGALLEKTDEQRHLQLLVAPNFLFTDGQALFVSQRKGVIRPVESFLGDGLKAGLLSFHFDDSVFFAEAVLASDASTDRHQLAARFGKQFADLPNALEEYIAQLDPHPYWRRIAFRYPSMVRFLQRQLRVQAEGRYVVANVALPSAAAHNLAFGAEMISASASADAPDRLRFKAEPRNLEEALSTKMSISFEQDSLEFAVQAITSEFQSLHGRLPFQFEIRILGEALELEGITRNQQIRGFEQTDKTLAEILTALVLQANPTPSSSASESAQKIIWATGPDPENKLDQVILITTRTSALEDDSLPEIFRAN